MQYRMVMIYRLSKSHFDYSKAGGGRSAILLQTREPNTAPIYIVLYIIILIIIIIMLYKRALKRREF